MLNVFGGKITTYRRLAEEAVDRLAKALDRDLPAWTAEGDPLPGGDFVDAERELVAWAPPLALVADGTGTSLCCDITAPAPRH